MNPATSLDGCATLGLHIRHNNSTNRPISENHDTVQDANHLSHAQIVRQVLAQSLGNIFAAKRSDRDAQAIDVLC